jgi:GDPmannose 4,6-dehydratase
MKAAFITGVTGQDGSYLAEILLEKGYDVFGMVRYVKSGLNRYSTLEGDLTDGSRINAIINSFEPYDLIEVYNLGGVSHMVRASEQPEHTMNVALGTLRILEAIRQTSFSSKFKFLQAGSAYVDTLCAQSKFLSKMITSNYRQTYGLYACTADMSNHESERRRPEFVSRKITLGLAEWIKTKTPFELGNIDSKRDWGYAPDYVEAMWLMLQKDTAGDEVIGTGKSHSVRQFVNAACIHVNIKSGWSGSGEDEVCFDLATGSTIVKINPELYRAIDSEELCVETKHPNVKVSFEELVKKMVDNDCK